MNSSDSPLPIPNPDRSVSDDTRTRELDIDRVRRTNNFDLLRFLLAVMVVFSHSYALGLNDDAGEPLNRLSRGQGSCGALAVDGFFIISGLLITQSWERRKSLLDFARKRVTRIYPGFIVASLFGLLIGWTIAVPAGEPRIGLGRFILQTAQLRTIEPEKSFVNNAYPNAINGSLWSIPFEFWCYIGVAVLGLTTLLARPRVLIGLFVASLLAAYVFPAMHLQWIGGGFIGKVIGWPFFWARLLPCYLAGVVMYRFRSSIHPTNFGAAASVAILAAMIFVPYGWSVALPVCFAYLVFWFAYHPRISTAGFAKHGDVSYGLYLYAFPIQQLVVQSFGGWMSPWKLFAIALPISVLAGAISWFAVERWFLGRNRRAQLPAVLEPTPAITEPEGDFEEIAPIV